MFSIVEICCNIKGKIGLICCQFLHDLLKTFFRFNLVVNLHCSLSNSVHLRGIFKDIEKILNNSMLLGQLFDGLKYEIIEFL